MTRTVLIVDDDPEGVFLTEMAVSMLERDIRTESATSGRQALEYLSLTTNLPDAVLLDLKMPGMSGLETLAVIRMDGRLKDLPVIITTHSSLESDAESARKAGATAFVQKAIRLEEFSKDIGLQLDDLMTR